MIKRARLFFFVALLLALLIVLANFPLGALVEGRSAVRADTAQLWRCKPRTAPFVSGEGSARSGDRRANRTRGIRFGHARPAFRRGAARGGRIVMPPRPTRSRTTRSRSPTCCRATRSSALRAPAQPPVPEPGFWHRVLATLEFWHSLF